MSWLAWQTRLVDNRSVFRRALGDQVKEIPTPALSRRSSEAVRAKTQKYMHELQKIGRIRRQGAGRIGAGIRAFPMISSIE